MQSPVHSPFYSNDPVKVAKNCRDSLQPFARCPSKNERMKHFALPRLLGRWSGIALVTLATTTGFAATPTVADIPAPPTDAVAAPAVVPTPPPLTDHEVPPPRPAQHRFRPEEFVPLVALSIPILAIVLSLGIGGLAIWVEYRKRRDLLTACHTERMAAIEKGLELPPFPAEFQGGAKRISWPRSTGLKPGLVLVGTGIGLFMIHFRPGFIVIFVGIAFLVYYAIEGRKIKPTLIEPPTCS